MSKRTLDAFFSSPKKKAKQEDESLETQVSRDPAVTITTPTEKKNQLASQDQTCPATTHRTYAWPISDLPKDISEALDEILLTAQGREINDKPHLDLLYFQPLIPQPTADQLFKFLRSSLPFYRVCYTISRFGQCIDIKTPRFTTVFGIDETSKFTSTISSSSSNSNTSTQILSLTTQIIESHSTNPSNPVPVSKSKYKCTPRPIPPCLAVLKSLTEALTHDTYNFVLVNYYVDGTDSISYHSDDERFLGPFPAIASWTFGTRRDFLLKHKPPATGPAKSGNKGTSVMQDGVQVDQTPVKFALGSGDLLLMRGETQANWLHSIPKRTAKGGGEKGRINITMRKAMVPAGTENYYRYNVGEPGENPLVYRWDEKYQEMRVWNGMRDRSV